MSKGTKTGRVGPFQATKMVLEPNQTAFQFSPTGPKMWPDLVLGPFLARTKTAIQAGLVDVHYYTAIQLCMEQH